MDDTPHPAESPDTSSETEEARKRRIASEAKMIAEAVAELDAGWYVDGDEMDAWMKSIGTDRELPLPRTRHR